MVKEISKQPSVSIERMPEKDFVEDGLFGTKMDLKTYKLGVNAELSKEQLESILHAVCEVFHGKVYRPQ